MKIRFLLFLACSFFSTLAFSNEKEKQTVMKLEQSQVIVGQSSQGDLIYFAKQKDGTLKQVTMSFFTDNLEKAVEEAKKVVCEMNVLPEQVTISSVIVSVTYSTKQFCPKK